jgi:DNA-binding response OmpR family regulator
VSEKKYNVVAIDDDEFFLSSITTWLPESEVTISTSTDIIDESLCGQVDIFLLDIDLGEETGYATCEKIRASNAWVPILFISNLTDTESRLKAYGVGGNDYLPKPFQADELNFKVDSLVKTFQRKKALIQELDHSSNLVLQVQTSSSKLREINRFILSSAQCKEEETIYQIFFHTLKMLDITGVLKIDGFEPRASAGEISRLESDIMNLSDRLERIQTFGQERAFYNWKNCQLLVRNLNGLVDELAILMDALEICVERVGNEKKLVAQVAQFGQESQYSREIVSVLLNDMTLEISDQLLTLGLVSSLDLEEEEKIRNVMESFQEKIQQRLLKQEKDGLELGQTISSMRVVSDDFQQYLDTIEQEDSNDSFELF